MARGSAASSWNMDQEEWSHSDAKDYSGVGQWQLDDTGEESYWIRLTSSRPVTLKNLGVST